MALKYCLVLMACFLIINPTEAGWFRRTLRNIGRALKKIGCKALYGIACPLVVNGAAGALAAGTSGLGTAVVAVGAAAGNNRCHVKRDNCKREADALILAFSDNFTDFDTNGDNLISYEEFVFSVMGSVDMANAEELEEPFLAADSNGDDHLDKDEFEDAPFLFANTESTLTTSGQTPVSTNVTSLQN